MTTTCHDPSVELMEDHGVVRRVLGLYAATLSRLTTPDAPPVPWPAFRAALDLMRTYVEDHHERVEEAIVFPMSRAEPALLAQLVVQHRHGRRLHDEMRALASGSGFGRARAHQEIARRLAVLIPTLHAHTAAEDTRVFPTVLASRRAHLLRLLDEADARDQVPSYPLVLARVARLEASYDLDPLVPVAPR